MTAIDEAVDSGRPGNHTLRIIFSNGERVFLKLRIDGDAARNRREVATTRYAIDHCSVRVPTVIAADSAFNPPYLATSPLDGTPASTDWEADESQETIARDIGRVVAGITTARFDDHGWITGGDRDHLDRETGAWSAVLADAIEREANDVPSERFAGVPERAADLVRGKTDVLDGASPALLYPDVRLENVFQNGRPGVIDWEWTLVGDPGLGLCWGEAWVAERADVSDSDRGRLRAAVHDGYCEWAGELPQRFDRRRPIYRLVTFLQTAKTFPLWAPSAPEATTDLAEWVRDELDERFAAAEAVC
nr:phosphotransferase [Natrinema sp. SYSU A 869]